MNANGGVGHRQRFTVTAPTGTSWAALPAGCSASGSGIDGRDLTCVLGDVAEGQVVAVSVVLDVSTGLDDGDAVIVTGTATADDADTPVSATAPRLTVSAAARYNLSKRVVGSVLRPDVTGPDGTRGFQLVFPIAVDWQPVVPGQGLLGFAPGDGRMTFTDDVSQLRGDLPSGAVLWNGDAPPCGPNDPSVSSRFASLPAGSGGGPPGGRRLRPVHVRAVRCRSGRLRDDHRDRHRRVTHADAERLRRPRRRQHPRVRGLGLHLVLGAEPTRRHESRIGEHVPRRPDARGVRDTELPRRRRTRGGQPSDTEHRGGRRRDRGGSVSSGCWTTAVGPATVRRVGATRGARPGRCSAAT
ncbi:hypothetical protein [Curtobacterium sp. MCPF17_052]|uniref:hypothetical protein n=1 Tax=Curtobacterium sp. MCPF17_052 TaxID=2175655 RepID=UPI0024E01D2C|nr:hypothetical protein [Curtobacterium sp. MCPF17_052]WIB12181.1 hypothetical protein DEJ36_15730 [Curtobacterium sp. MCPF17_052]